MLKQVMHTKMDSISFGLSLVEVNNIMIEKNLRRLPVVLKGQLIGVVNQSDIIKIIRDFLVKQKTNSKPSGKQ
jgi:tRNA nucleotidyltransferase (CCA-adding enzyme)